MERSLLQHDACVRQCLDAMCDASEAERSQVFFAYVESLAGCPEEDYIRKCGRLLLSFFKRQLLAAVDKLDESKLKRLTNSLNYARRRVFNVRPKEHEALRFRPVSLAPADICSVLEEEPDSKSTAVLGRLVLHYERAGKPRFQYNLSEWMQAVRFKPRSGNQALVYLLFALRVLPYGLEVPPLDKMDCEEITDHTQLLMPSNVP
jgi:hypothetical protein